MTDRLEFIKEVLKNAPAGQFNALLEDIQKLSGDPLDGEVLTDIKKRYESQTCSGAPTAAGAGEGNPLIASLEALVEKHQEEVYGKAGAAGSVTARRDIATKEGNNILLRTYAERVDKERSRSGYWTAEWTIKSDADTAAELSGQLSICSFSFEDGNVQLRSTMDFPATTVEKGDSSDDLATEIMKQISKWENKVLLSLQHSCSRVGQNLKSIRGILPLTHRKLNWNVVAQRTVRSLQETVSK